MLLEPLFTRSFQQSFDIAAFALTAFHGIYTEPCALSIFSQTLSISRILHQSLHKIFVRYDDHSRSRSLEQSLECLDLSEFGGKGGDIFVLFVGVNNKYN